MKTKADSSSPDKSTLEAPVVRHRVVVPIQTRGGIGKSTEAVARASWMDQRGVQWQGFDLDEQNRTFSDNSPVRRRWWKFPRANRKATSFACFAKPPKPK